MPLIYENHMTKLRIAAYDHWSCSFGWLRFDCSVIFFWMIWWIWNGTFLVFNVYNSHHCRCSASRWIEWSSAMISTILLPAAYSGQAWVKCEMPSVYDHVHPAGSGMPLIFDIVRIILFDLFPFFFFCLFLLFLFPPSWFDFVVDFCNLYPAHSFYSSCFLFGLYLTNNPIWSDLVLMFMFMFMFAITIPLGPYHFPPPCAVYTM